MNKRKIFTAIFSIFMLTLLHCAKPTSTNEKNVEQITSTNDAGAGSETNGEQSSLPEKKMMTEKKQAHPDEKKNLDTSYFTTNWLHQMLVKIAADDTNGRDEGTPGNALARKRIIEVLKSCGVQPIQGNSYTQKITTGKGTNILGLIPGSDPRLKERHVLISAHYDHLGACNGGICNGADDNAAGVATILAIACVLAQQPPKRSILVASWDAEEPPTFLKPDMGSLFYVNHPIIPLAKIDVAIVLDLVGGGLWKDYKGHFLLGSELSPQVDQAIDATPVPKGLSVYRGGLHLVENTVRGKMPWSDYHGFRNNGVPVLFLSNGQNKRYHTPIDEIKMLDFPKMSLQTEFLYHLVNNLANATKTPQFNEKGTIYQHDADTTVSVLIAALAKGGLADSLNLTQQSRAKLRRSLSEAKAIQAKLKSGGSLTIQEIRSLRYAIQRIMCYSGPLYSEKICNLVMP